MNCVVCATAVSADGGSCTTCRVLFCSACARGRLVPSPTGPSPAGESGTGAKNVCIKCLGSDVACSQCHTGWVSKHCAADVKAGARANHGALCLACSGTCLSCGTSMCKLCRSEQGDKGCCATRVCADCFAEDARKCLQCRRTFQCSFCSRNEVKALTQTCGPVPWRFERTFPAHRDTLSFCSDCFVSRNAGLLACVVCKAKPLSKASLSSRKVCYRCRCRLVCQDCDANACPCSAKLIRRTGRQRQAIVGRVVSSSLELQTEAGEG